MSKSQSAGKVFGTILFIILAAVSIYYIYLGYDFIKSIIRNVKRSGFAFYDRFPSALWYGILEYVLGTVLIIVLTVKQSLYVFGAAKQRWKLSPVLTSAVLILMAASEIMSFKSYTILLGRGYSLLNHLQTYLCASGIIRVLIFLFFIFYLIYSMILALKGKPQADKI